MQSILYQFQKRQIALMARVTPYAMAGHIANTTVVVIALAGSVRLAPLIIWCAYSYATALFLFYRRVRNRGSGPRSFQRVANKAMIYAFALALPWSSLAVLYLGSLSHGQELLLVALGIGMAACGTILLSAIPAAAFSYMSVIMLPSSMKCFLVGQKDYFLLGTLALSYWGCFAALIAKTSRDNWERQESELALSERNAQIALAGTAALVGSYGYDVKGGKMQVSEGYAAIHGLPEGTTETSYSEWRARVHPEDLGRAEGLRDQAFADQGKEDNAEYRIVLSTGEVRWIERRGSISYGEDGRPERVVGVNIDITERKRAELALAERNTQLALAGQAALVGSYAYDVKTRMLQFSEGYAAIYDLPDGTTEMTGSQRRALVHPEDLERLDSVRNQAYKQRQSEYSIEYRNILPKRGVRWIESRSLIFYDSDGRPQRLVGVNIDITERKRAEETQKLLIAELDHRVKNALATITAVVSHTSEEKNSVADFLAALEGRIQSMAAAHELLSSRQWQGMSLTELVWRELSPYSASNNVDISGSEVMLNPQAGQAIAMVLHELVTNAAKYGALSSSRGRVFVRWDCQSDGSASGRLVIEWRESSGPPVMAPSVSGYGTRVIRNLIPYEFDGIVDYVPAQDGVRCTLQLPITLVSNRTVRVDPLNGDHRGLHKAS